MIACFEKFRRTLSERPMRLCSNLRSLCVSVVKFVHCHVSTATQGIRISAWVIFILPVLMVTIMGFVMTKTSSASTASSYSEFSSVDQQTMQMPEGLDYSKFQHSSRNHSRLPCLLCHRREGNASLPKLPGSNGHLPCAGCHAQQFSEFRHSHVHDLSHRRENGRNEIIPTFEEFSDEVRPFVTCQDGKRQLRHLS